MRPTTTILLLATALPACTTASPPLGSAPTAVAAQQQGVQSLIKFKNPKISVDSGLLARLGQTTGSRIEYIRAMSTDVHVIRVTPQGTTRYEQVLTALRASPEVAYVEPDAVMHIQR